MKGLERERREQAVDETGENDSVERIYVPPYTVRAKAKRDRYMLGTPAADEDEGEPRDLSIYASISRSGASTALIPGSGLELDLGWGGRSLLDWLPGGKLIPRQLGLALIRPQQTEVVTRDREDLGILRATAKSIVGRLPVLWRLAALL